MSIILFMLKWVFETLIADNLLYFSKSVTSTGQIFVPFGQLMFVLIEFLSIYKFILLIVN